MYEDFARLVESEFGDIDTEWQFIYRRASIPLKLRLQIRDQTYVDIWISDDLHRYSFHWEQRAVRGMIHRYDNAPDHPKIATFPRHFHDGSEDNVLPSIIPDEPQEMLRGFLTFVRQKLIELEM